jgi:phage baseplate assembly protein W
MSKYTDLNTLYDETTHLSKSIIKDLNNIKQSLLRLFLTPKGSIPFNRSYGTSLRSLLFENDIDPADITMFLYMDITDWEPRVELNPNDISISKVDANTYSVSCYFRVPSLTETTSSVSVTISDK